MFKTSMAVMGLVLSAVIGTASLPAYAALPFNLMGGEEVPTLAPMLKKAMPAVVNISTSGKVMKQENPLLNDPFFRRFFKDFDIPVVPKEQRTQSIGSGVIVDASKGYVLTNHHVVNNADEIFVVLKDKRKLKAKLIGSDEETDVALLQVKEDNLTDIPLGDSSKVEVGDFAVAIGNPFGLGHTVTSGIVSAIGRTGLGIEGYEDFIQTDASINPGNSGGALINLKGELIGINTAILAPNGGNVGIGFAIPINMIKDVIAQLVEHGEIKRGQIGVHIQDITPDLADVLKLDSTSGAIVAKVAEGSPAEKAGIKTGDVITAFEGKPVESASALKNQVGMMRIGEKADLEVLRNNEKKHFTVQVGKRETPQEAKAQTADIPLLKGASFAPLTAAHPLYGHVQGVVVAEVERESAAWQAGLRKDDVIVSVNQREVTSVDALLAQAKEAKNGILLNLRRGDAALFIVVK